ncbi:hypothetical protein ACTHQN_02080 [Curtobacterium flaccumfaciens]|uniref:hypothetical protein n=1 Tax=Curtobacterium flaccumfaciens TaxID=2035 RepID=UPI003F81C530
MTADQYDPPSPTVLDTVAWHVVDLLNESVGTWRHHQELLPELADSADVVPPFVREFDVLYACADDWHGGNAAPGIRRVFGELERAGAIRPLRAPAVAALEDFHVRWALRHGVKPSQSGRETATWEVADADRFDQTVLAFARHGDRQLSGAVRAAVARFAVPSSSACDPD